jgi:hypothetical protein
VTVSATSGPVRREDSSLLARVFAAPVLSLALLVGLSTLFRASIGIGVPSPWILPDEILYSDIARSIADGGPPEVRGVSALGWGVVYPAIVAPAWVVLADPVWAYHGALLINELVMSSAAIPAYLLARLFVSSRLALAVGAMTVLVPSMAYTGVVMTENAFYPLFLWVVLLIARATRHPTLAAQLLAVGGVVLLTATRIQGIVLAGAAVAAVVLYAKSGPRGERGAYARRFLPTIGLAAAVALAGLAVLAVRGDDLLGRRSGTFDGLRLVEVPQWLGYLAGGLVLYVALIPAAATAMVAIGGLRTRASEPERLFAAVVIPLVVAVLGIVAFVSAAIDVDGTENLNERYVFYVVPLLFVGLALWIRQGLPRSRPTAWIVLAACAAFALLVPIERLEYNAGFQSVALLPWLSLADSRALLLVGLAAFLILAGALWLRSRREQVARLWLVVGAWMAFVGVLVVADNSDSASFYARSFDARPADWIDRAVPDGERVAVVWRQRPGRTAPEGVAYWLMVAELFNATVSDVHRIGPRTYYEDILPTIPVDVRAGTLLRPEDGSPVRARYVLVTCGTPVEGRVVARSPYGALQLIEVRSPIRLGRANCRDGR